MLFSDDSDLISLSLSFSKTSGSFWKKRKVFFTVIENNSLSIFLFLSFCWCCLLNLKF